MAVIFQPSDLNQRGRAILDAARQGGARIRDKDGLGLLVLPEEHVEALETAARFAIEFLAIERVMPQATAEQVIAEWHTTAEQLADPRRRQILLEPISAVDYVEAESPELAESDGVNRGRDAAGSNE